MTKHSPGPWRAYFGSVVDADDRSILSRSFHLAGEAADAEVNANAQLAASAPEMLALLRECEFGGPMNSGQFTCPMCKAKPHANDCKYAALLKRLEE